MVKIRDWQPFCHSLRQACLQEKLSPGPFVAMCQVSSSQNCQTGAVLGWQTGMAAPHLLSPTAQ